MHELRDEWPVNPSRVPLFTSRSYTSSDCQLTLDSGYDQSPASDSNGSELASMWGNIVGQNAWVSGCSDLKHSDLGAILAQAFGFKEVLALALSGV